MKEGGLNLNRFQEVKQVRQEVIEALPEDKKNDFGEIRLAVSRVMMDRDNKLRYFLNK